MREELLENKTVSKSTVEMVDEMLGREYKGERTVHFSDMVKSVYIIYKDIEKIKNKLEINKKDLKPNIKI